MRFETAPGQQLQIDFGSATLEIDGARQKVHVFVATLGYSRLGYVAAFRHERQAAWLAGLEGAFAHFGGIPREVLLDNAKALVFAGLWTSVCIVGPALSALAQGYEVYFISDACGDVSNEAHERAVTRMVQAGAQPMTSLQYLLELQRDWARSETYDMTTGVAKKFGGAYGLGVTYAKTMFGASEGH